jgi:hypothetical protein
MNQMLLICGTKSISGGNDHFYYVFNHPGMERENGSLVFFLCSVVSGNGVKEMACLSGYPVNDK